MDNMTGHFENGRWITIDPKLKSWYEEDIILIDSLLEHTTYEPQRERLMNERKRRVELIGNSE